MQQEIQNHKGSAFQNMRVWQKAMTLTSLVYKIARQLPKEELFALSSQIRRCAVSVPSNIAEGSKRGTKKDFLQFLRIASGSAAELETQLLLVRREYSVPIEEASKELNELQRMLESLMSKV
jgi:four helix bundle protein